MKELVAPESNTRWQILLIRAQNGWILEYLDETDSDEQHKVEQIFEDSEEDGGEKLSLINALRTIVDFFGQGGSKHDTKRIAIQYTDKWNEE